LQNAESLLASAKGRSGEVTREMSWSFDDESLELPRSPSYDSNAYIYQNEKLEEHKTTDKKFLNEEVSSESIDTMSLIELPREVNGEEKSCRSRRLHVTRNEGIDIVTTPPDIFKFSSGILKPLYDQRILQKS